MKTSALLGSWRSKYARAPGRASSPAARAGISLTARPTAPSGDRKSASTAAIRAERERWAAVLSSAKAGSHRQTAVKLLGDTDLPADAILAIVASGPKADWRSKMDARLEAIRGFKQPVALPSDPSATAAMIIEAYEQCVGGRS